MAKITVLGNALTLTTDIAAEQIKKANKYCPEVTTLVSEEQEPYFHVQMGDSPSCSKYGVSFDQINQEGKAYLTVVGVPREGNTKEDVKEEFGSILYNLDKVETQIIDGLGEINERLAQIERKITVID